MYPIRIQQGLHKTVQNASLRKDKTPGGWLTRMWRALISERKQTKSLRHIESLSLGAKRTLFLVECDGQRYLVADGMTAPVPVVSPRVMEGSR